MAINKHAKELAKPETPDLIRTTREAKGWTMMRLHLEAIVDLGTIRRCERGRGIREILLLRLYRALDLDPEEHPYRLTRAEPPVPRRNVAQQ